MRWMTAIAGLALASVLAIGCKQQCFLTEPDLQHYQEALVNTPSGLECDPSAGSQPCKELLVPAPSTVVHPERNIRYISLAEAIAIALEHGKVFGGVTAPANNPSAIQGEVLGSFTGRFGPTTLDSIRVFALDPAITYSGIEAAESKFDARWVTSMSWTTTEQPVGNAQTGIQTLTQGNNTLASINSQNANLTSSLLKPLPTGGVAGITFMTDYSLTNSPLARINPTYTPTLQFNFEQPLLQGYGVEINQLRAQHPGGILTGDQFPTTSANTNEGILITRLRFDQQRAEFERNVQLLVLHVERAYWNLYSAYWDLYSREQALRQAFAAWRITIAQLQAGRKTAADLAQTRGQYELFRGDRIESLGRLLSQERDLRALLGLQLEDCTRLVPSDEPTLAPYQPDWCSALNETLTLRPELVMAREELKVSQMNVILSKNQLLPDLRFTSTYGITSIGSHLDGSDDNNAFRKLASDHFNNWSAGLRLEMPLGYRDAHSGLRIARLNLARSYGILRDIEYNATLFLADQYRLISERYQVIEARRSQRIAFAEQLRVRSDEYIVGRGTLDILLEAQRFWATALASEYAAISDYNNALANFEFAKGTILRHDNIYIAEGPLPQCAQVRAVEHERERTKALVLLERAEPAIHPSGHTDAEALATPAVPTDKAATLPNLLNTAPLPGSGPIEKLPFPKPVPPGAPATPAATPMLPPVTGMAPAETAPTSAPQAAAPTQPVPNDTKAPPQPLPQGNEPSTLPVTPTGNEPALPPPS